MQQCQMRQINHHFVSALGPPWLSDFKLGGWREAKGKGPRHAEKQCTLLHGEPREKQRDAVERLGCPRLIDWKDASRSRSRGLLGSLTAKAPRHQMKTDKTWYINISFKISSRTVPSAVERHSPCSIHPSIHRNIHYFYVMYKPNLLDINHLFLFPPPPPSESVFLRFLPSRRQYSFFSRFSRSAFFSRLSAALAR